ncbi:sulfatase-like hydrolase/transferase [candidate division KSB1 bacterium]|nr:sulfatase-like hydrolase/transferase [candidate division KSB1 bacterium]
MLAAGSGVLVLSCGSKIQQTPAGGKSVKRPNILWISCEDISPRLGCYGDKVARTPVLDKMASEGIRFSNFFTAAPVCAPNRSAIITGMYQTSIGTHHMRTSHKAEGLPTPYSAVPPHYVKTFTEYMRAAGYFCTNNVKTDYQFETPITAWDECSRTAHWRNRPDKDQPFFCVINFTTTHESQNWPDPEVTDPATVPVEPYYPDTPIVRNKIARLYDNIAKLDSQVGKVLEQLNEDGLAEDTIVFFWSDHGDGLPRKKRWIYDSGTHVPLIVRWPQTIRPGSVNHDLISSIDLGPTVLSLASIEIPRHMQGRAFLGLQKKAAREYVFSARDRFDNSYDMVRSVRDKKYRYVRNFYPEKPYIIWVPYRNRSGIMQEILRLQAEGELDGAQNLWIADNRPAEELYDCDADPHNINNLAYDSKYKAVLERLSRVLDEWREKSGDMGDISELEMVNRWYPGGIQPQTHRVMFIPNAPSNRGATAVESFVRLQSPAMIKLHCPTQGASIAYTLESGEEPYWLLYTGPLSTSPGEITIRARAIRYGYKESEEAALTVVCE